uniref:ANK_REP_REGION domain-containing protein n=1 Tax=Gongylonema pulchrum TaxID=637853 RepID=A0A183EII6_9BILA
LLLEVMNDVNSRSADGSTALHFACEYGRIARAKALIAKGIPVDAATSTHGVTALHMASRHGHDLIVKHLLVAGAQCNLKTKSGHTPLHLAALHGYVNVVRTLCNNGADVNEVDNIGRTALHAAIQSASSNSEFVIDYLLSAASTSVLKVDVKGRSALHYAARSGFFHALQKLLGAGLQPTDQDHRGCTPLHYAAQAPSDLALISTKVLLRADDTVAQIRDLVGFLPIHYAVKAGNLDTAQILADAMTDRTAPSSGIPYNLNVYHIAARHNHAQLLQKLLATYHMYSMLLDKEEAAKISGTIGLELDAYERLPIHYAMSYGWCYSISVVNLPTVPHTVLHASFRTDSAICVCSSGVKHR